MLVRASSLAESMSRDLIQRISENPFIELLCNSELSGLEGENRLEEVSWINKQTGQTCSWRPITCSSWSAPLRTPTVCKALSLSTRRASSLPDATYLLRLTESESYLAASARALSCLRAACRESSQSAMSLLGA